jgi:SM-20-related protein
MLAASPLIDVSSRVGSPPSAHLNLEAFEATPLGTDPFDHVIMPGFLDPADCAAARADFPLSEFGGLAPAPEEAAMNGLGRLIAALRDPAVTEAFSEKFGVALDPEALMIHLRSRCQERDGRIHADSRDKVVTALIYLNDGWPHPGGRLRLLRNPDDLEDYAAEAPPLDGLLVAFRRTDHSWHGHHPHVGVRRCVMFNWMTSKAVAKRELKRHALSSGMKRMLFAPFTGRR